VCGPVYDAVRRKAEKEGQEVDIPTFLRTHGTTRITDCPENENEYIPITGGICVKYVSDSNVYWQPALCTGQAVTWEEFERDMNKSPSCSDEHPVPSYPTTRKDEEPSTTTDTRTDTPVPAVETPTSPKTPRTETPTSPKTPIEHLRGAIDMLREWMSSLTLRSRSGEGSSA
jgi:hypothetical protein